MPENLSSTISKYFQARAQRVNITQYQKSLDNGTGVWYYGFVISI